MSLIFKTKPRGPQEAAVKLAMSRTGTGIFLSMGLGKTKTAIDVHHNSRFRRVLIVCPKAVVSVWPYQYGIHSPAPYPILALDTNHTTAQKAQMVRDFKDGVIVVNYESAAYGFNAAGKRHTGLTDALYAWKPEMVVSDESHRIKGAQSKQSKFMWDLGRQPFVAKRLGLTGTPYHHSEVDIFAQMRFIDQSIFGQYITHFRRRFMYQPVPDKIPNKWSFRPNMRAELERVVGQASITGLTRDAVDLPPVQDVEIPLELGPKARRVYDALRHEFIAELDAGVITAANAAVKSGKLRQITGGSCYGEDNDGEKVLHVVETPKKDALTEILDGIPRGEKIVVFSAFRADVHMTAECAEATGHRVHRLNGENNELAAWMTGDGVLACNIRSGGAGVDLSGACYGVFLNHGTSFGDYEQARARLDRPGQTRPVTFWHLICTGTLDRAVYRAMQEKGSVIGAMMAAMRGDFSSSSAA